MFFTAAHLLFGIETADLLAGRNLPQLRLLLQTSLCCILAPRGKLTSFRQRQRVRHRARDGLEPGAHAVQSGDGVHQALRVRMARWTVCEDDLRRGLLHYLAAIHDDYVVRHLVDDAQIVRDEDDGRAVVALQIVHQAQNLCLDGHVERGGGLVGNQDPGLAGQRHGDHHALAHAAGELVRILQQHGLRVGDLHGIEHFQRLFFRLLFVQFLMDDERLAKLPLDGKDRVQAGHRLLKDDGNLVAANFVHLLLGELGQIAPLEQDLAFGNIAVAVQQLQDAHRRNRFAGTGLAHDPDRPARLQRIRHVVDRFDDALPRLEIGMKVFHFQ